MACWLEAFAGPVSVTACGVSRRSTQGRFRDQLPPHDPQPPWHGATACRLRSSTQTDDRRCPDGMEAALVVAREVLADHPHVLACRVPRSRHESRIGGDDRPPRVMMHHSRPRATSRPGRAGQQSPSHGRQCGLFARPARRFMPGDVMRRGGVSQRRDAGRHPDRETHSGHSLGAPGGSGYPVVTDSTSGRLRSSARSFGARTLA